MHIRRGNLEFQNPKAAEILLLRVLPKPVSGFSPLSVFGVLLGFKFCPLGFQKLLSKFLKNQTRETRGSENPKENSKHKEENMDYSGKHGLFYKKY